jgi:hypothetical protein
MILTPTDQEYGDLMDSSSINVDAIADNKCPEVVDKYIEAQLKLELAGEEMQGTVIGQATDPVGNKIGQAHSNPLFDTPKFMVRFEDESIHRFRANQIAEAIYSQVDQEGKQYLILDDILYHQKDRSAINRADGYWTSYNGNKVPKKTTQGWKLCVQWKDGTTTWVSLAELKDSNPLELAEYGVVNGIQDEPAFNWWVKDIMRVRTSIISKVKSRYWRTTHKYWVRLPHSVEEALQINCNTGTALWQETILKERTRVCIAWMARDNVTPDKVRIGKVKDMIGYQEITCHMIFDVKRILPERQDLLQAD